MNLDLDDLLTNDLQEPTEFSRNMIRIPRYLMMTR